MRHDRIPERHFSRILRCTRIFAGFLRESGPDSRAIGDSELLETGLPNGAESVSAPLTGVYHFFPGVGLRIPMDYLTMRMC